MHGPDGSPLSIVRTRPGASDERFNYHTDALGSVVAITSEAGTVVASYRYGAFGEVLATGGSDAALAERNPLRYRAYYYDTHAALYYLPARYYDPASARFLSPDPAPASAGDPRTLDRYMYCTGDPVNYYDPSGAYLAAGGGASKVSDEAIALAKDDLAAAIAVQDAYRKAVAASYASGLSYDAAHAAAEQAAAERAAALAERDRALAINSWKAIGLGVAAVGLGIASVALIVASGGTGTPLVAAAALSLGGMAFAGWSLDATERQWQAGEISPAEYKAQKTLGWWGMGVSAGSGAAAFAGAPVGVQAYMAVHGLNVATVGLTLSSAQALREWTR
ncbi:MAG: RHS repeat-associated core domain-containing protein [Coriobacteriia bacterium]|nr:RHS repeat-associated core domain-containing protein [Coriobacteriia bacterium]